MHLILISLAFAAAALGLSREARAQGTPAGSSSSYFSRSRGNAFNPALSANLLGLYRRGNRGNDAASPQPNGLVFQETEVQMTADVDPYFRAITLLSVHPKAAPNQTEFEITPEEVFFETLSLPRVLLKGGKFKAKFGRTNLMHTHALPFIDLPLIHTRLFGDEGLNELGVSASVLLPTSWFSEVTVQALGGRSTTLFNSTSPNDVAGLVDLTNLWDLSDALTLELGFSGVSGSNAFGASSSVYGADLTMKWRPVTGGKYTSLAWSTEYLNGMLKRNPAGDRQGGVASWLQYQFAERWWAQARYEFAGLPRSETIDAARKQSALLAFVPSEFSALRLQYDRLKDASPNPENRVLLQLNLSIGAHPAHAY